MVYVYRRAVVKLTWRLQKGYKMQLFKICQQFSFYFTANKSTNSIRGSLASNTDALAISAAAICP
jgi:hypothetical protein